MTTFEFAIAVCDEPESHRKQEGDIIAVKASPWKWGKKELKQYLIIVVDGLEKEEADKLCIPQFKSGEDWWPSYELFQPEIVAKRRFKVELNILKSNFDPNMDLLKVKNKTEEYQPIKDKNIIITTNSIETTSLIYDKYSKISYIKR